jgi:hypothetical protein
MTSITPIMSSSTMYAYKSRMDEQIFMKFGTHIIKLEATPSSYFVISYNH